jgi:magnesium-transporting ATPase (P-type)
VVKCSGVLQCSDGLSNKVSNIIKRLMDNIKLLFICILRVLSSQYFFINVYVFLFLFNNVIYVFLLHDCLCMTTLTEVFPCFFLSCKANARVMPAKTGHGPHSS